MNIKDTKRLLFAFEAYAPFPSNIDLSSNINGQKNHVTLLFFGDVSYKKIHETIRYMPKPSFKVGLAGLSTGLIQIPKRDPSLLTCNVDLLGTKQIDFYQSQIMDYYTQYGFDFKGKKFLKHITLGTSSIPDQELMGLLFPLPLYLKNLNLFEVRPGERFESIWTYDLLPPFVEHDLGHYVIHGESFQQIFINAQIALAFKNPRFTPFIDSSYQVRNLHDGGVMLTTLINKAYRLAGVEIEKVSFSDNGSQANGVLVWDFFVRT